MRTTKKKTSRQRKDGAPDTRANAFTVNMPAFLIEEPTGLGDVIKKATHYLGIPTCGGCEKRAAALNNWFVIAPRK